MRQCDKKALREISAKMDEVLELIEWLQTDHQEWMDERDYETDGKFSESETGERAEDDQYSFDEFYDTAESLRDDIDELIGD